MWKIISVAVEVPQGTLSADGRGWGPAWNTEQRWSRSGREHWAPMIAVAGWHWTWRLPADTGHWAARRRRRRRRTRKKDEEEEEEEEEAEEANIKSNNPHLTGGEKHLKLILAPTETRIQIRMDCCTWKPIPQGHSRFYTQYQSYGAYYIKLSP